MWVLAQNQALGGAVELAELEKMAKGLSDLLTPELGETEVSQVVVLVSTKANVRQTDDHGVFDETFRPWMTSRKGETDEDRWNAYKGMLVERGWAPAVVQALDKQTDAVVELMGDPHTAAPWARRGLLMGEVQSGKTATYLGVLNKAIDYGYRVIVILGGHTNDLRSQTQVRVDHDLSGVNSAYLGDNVGADGARMLVGIGLVDQSFRTNAMTTIKSDFSASSKLANMVWVTTGVPTVFVIKKHVKMIENVRKYIAAQAPHQGFDLPLVVVDDEADWGSPNTNDPDVDPTRVNSAVRSLLDVSSRSSYLGITATPFANVLIDHTVEDDLFPSDYIRSLGTPSDYFGVGQYFGAPNEVVMTAVADCLAILPLVHKKEHFVENLPRSLEDALIAFLVGCAIRRTRDGLSRQSSMMVNVSRFNLVQKQFSGHIQEFVDALRVVISTELEREVGLARSPLMTRVVDSLQTTYPGAATFEDIRGALSAVSLQMRVELVNNGTATKRANLRRQLSVEQREALDLEPVVYVGGDVLSRGLTLEGLQVSYFIRQPASADTLLQMGRWFGYRPGYADLVRVWMPETTAELFGHVARISRELREDLAEMEAHGLNPRQFGLKIRLIPEIAIVSANKRKAANVIEIAVSLHGQIRQSVDLSSDKTVRRSNEQAVLSLLEKLLSQGNRFEPSGHQYGWADVPLEVVTGFIEKYSAHKVDAFFGSPDGKSGPQIAKFLTESKNRNAWDVVFIEGGGGCVKLPGLEHPLRASQRNKMEYYSSEQRLHFQRQQIASPSDLAGAFSDKERFLLSALLPDDAELTEGNLRRHGVKRPLLMIYAVTRTNDLDDFVATADEPLWAVRVVFPRMTLEEELDWIVKGGGTKILVNSVWQAQLAGYEVDPEPYDEEVDG